MKQLVRQSHIEWLEQQIETCQSIINRQTQRKATLTEALENAKGNSGSATLVEVPKKKAPYDGLTKTEKSVLHRIRLSYSSGMTMDELIKTTKLKRATIHTAIWSLKKNRGFEIHRREGRYVLLTDLQRTGS